MTALADSQAMLEGLELIKPIQTRAIVEEAVVDFVSSQCGGFIMGHESCKALKTRVSNCSLYNTSQNTKAHV